MRFWFIPADIVDPRPFSKGSSVPPYVIIAVALVVVIAVLALVSMKKKGKKKEDPQPEQKPETPELTEENKQGAEDPPASGTE